MAVARLARVTLEAPRDEIGVLLANVIGFTEFHPSKKDGMVQDFGLLLLGSRAQAVYAEASDLLKQEGPGRRRVKRTEVEKFEAHDVSDLVSVLEDYLGTIRETSPSSKRRRTGGE